MAIPAAELRAILKRERLTYDDLGKMLGRSGRLVQKWMTDGEVPSEYAPAVRAALRHEEQTPLSGFTNYELLAELSRRLDRSNGAATNSENAPTVSEVRDTPSGQQAGSTAGLPARKSARGWGGTTRT